jgi:ATP-dependent Clp protease protease subunit
MKIRLLVFIVLFGSLFYMFNTKAKTMILTEANSISLNQPVSPRSIANLQAKLINKCEQRQGKPIILVLNTPGGSVATGKNFLDFANALPCKIHTLTIFAASMGYQFVQNLGTRYIIDSGILMSHRAYIKGLEGNIPGGIGKMLKFLENMTRELDEKTAERIGISYEEYADLIRDDKWMTAKEAVEKNHADEIVKVRCGEGLEGTYAESVQVLFFNINVTFHKCPLILGPINVEPQQKNLSNIKIREINRYFDPSTYFEEIDAR